MLPAASGSMRAQLLALILLHGAAGASFLQGAVGDVAACNNCLSAPEKAYC